MVQAIINNIRRELEQQVDEKTRDGYRRYFKENVTFYGVKNGVVDKIAGRYYREINGMDKAGIFRICEDLLKSDYNEEALIAFD